MVKIIYTKKDFNIFKKECQKWIDYLGLHDWEIYYAWEQLKPNRFAEMNADFRSGACSISFTKQVEIDFNIVDQDDVRTHAKHEVMHLLLAKMSELGQNRYTDKDDLYATEEGIVHILVKKLKI